MQDPSPLEFLDYRRFLNAWFDHRRLRPSKSKFAKEVGCSRQLVSLICQGQRNLGEERALLWAKRMDLEEMDLTYFLALVRSVEGATKETRHAALGSIEAMRTFKKGNSKLSFLVGLFSHWLRPVIYEMRSCVGFEPSVSWIESHLGPKAARDDIADALGWLSNEGLLSSEGEKVIHAALATAHNEAPGVLTNALAHHHFELLEIAYQQLPNVPPKQRNYVNITAAVTREQQRRIDEELKEFQRRIYSIAAEPEGEDQRVFVYGLSMQLFPLTTVPDLAVDDEDDAEEE
ncbi:MAG: DUF4423 domain-containing protein [Myxococcota bacterium]